MEKKSKTEEQFKIEIFDFYAKCMDTTSSDRRQVYFGQLCDSIFRWYENYVYKKAGEMGLEIINTVTRMVKNGNKNIPKEKAGFFFYLEKSLKNARKEYHRNNLQNEEPKRFKLPRMVIDIEKLIEIRESSIGRELSNEEKCALISMFFNKTEKKALEYLKLMNAKNIRGFEYYDDGKEKNILDSKIVKSLFIGNVYDESIDKIISAQDLSIYLDDVKTVLEKKQKRTRPCNKALFTAFCIYEGMDLEALSPVLDREILEAYYKTMKKPLYSEIYMKYHPNTKKDSAEARATETIKNFIFELSSVVRKKLSV